EGTQVATLGVPWYVVAVDHAANERLIAEAFVFVVGDHNRISQESRKRYVFMLNIEQVIPEDLEMESTLIDAAQQFATGTIASWQFDAYNRSKAAVVLTPPSYQQVGVRLLYRLWM